MNPADARACNQCGQWIEQVSLEQTAEDRNKVRLHNIGILIVIFVFLALGGSGFFDGLINTDSGEQPVALSNSPSPTRRSTRTPGPTWTPRATRTTAPVPTVATIVHTVQSGDTLGKIARQYGVSVDAIVEANGIENPNALSVGTQLTIPTDEGASSGSGNAITNAPTATAVRPPQFWGFRDYYESHTEAQWIEYFNKYRGMEVDWTGTVMEVRESSRGYSVTVELDSGELFRESDVSWTVGREEALKIPKDGTIRFKGTLSDWSDLIWFSLELTDVTHNYQ